MLGGYEDGALCVLRPRYLLKELPYLLSRAQIQIGGRLVQNYELCIPYQGHSDGELASCSGRKVPHLFIELTEDINLESFLFDCCIHRGRVCDASEFTDKLKMLASGYLLKEEVVLLAEADVGTEGEEGFLKRNVLSRRYFEESITTIVICRQKTCEHIDQCGFARAVVAEEAHDFPRFDI